MKTEENESENSEKAKENQPLTSTRTPISELLKSRGVPSEDKTEERLGTTSLMFFPLQKNEQDDSVETMVRNLNRRKGQQEQE